MERGEEETGRAGMREKVNGRERKIWKWQKRQRTSGMLAYRYALRMCAERVKPGVCLWLGGGSERVKPLNQEPVLMAEAWDG